MRFLFFLFFLVFFSFNVSAYQSGPYCEKQLTELWSLQAQCTEAHKEQGGKCYTSYCSPPAGTLPMCAISYQKDSTSGCSNISVFNYLCDLYRCSPIVTVSVGRELNACADAQLAQNCPPPPPPPSSCVSPLTDGGSGGCNCPSEMGGGTPGQAQSGAYTQCTCPVGSAGAGLSYDVTSGDYSNFSSQGGTCSNPVGGSSLEKCPDGSAPVISASGDKTCESCSALSDGSGYFTSGGGDYSKTVCLSFKPEGSDTFSGVGCVVGKDIEKPILESPDGSEYGYLCSTTNSWGCSHNTVPVDLCMNECDNGNRVCELGGSSADGGSSSDGGGLPIGVPLNDTQTQELDNVNESIKQESISSCYENKNVLCDLDSTGQCPDGYVNGFIDGKPRCVNSNNTVPDSLKPSDDLIPPDVFGDRGPCMNGYSFSSSAPAPTSGNTYYRVYSPQTGYCVRTSDSTGDESSPYSWDNTKNEWQNMISAVNETTSMVGDVLDVYERGTQDMLQFGSDIKTGLDSMFNFFMGSAEAAALKQKETNGLLDDVTDLLDTINKLMSYQCTTTGGLVNYAGNVSVNNPQTPCYVEDVKAGESLDNIEDKLTQLGQLIEEKCEENKRCEVSDLVTQDWLQNIREEMDNVRPIYQSILAAVEDLDLTEGDAQIVDAIANLRAATMDLTVAVSDANTANVAGHSATKRAIEDLNVTNMQGHTDTKNAVLGMSATVNSSLNEGFTSILEKLDDNCARDRDCCEEILEQLRNLRQELNEHCGSPLHQNQNTGIGCKIYSAQLEGISSLMEQLNENLSVLASDLGNQLNTINGRLEKLCTPLEPCSYKEYQAEEFIRRIPETLVPIEEALSELTALQEDFDITAIPMVDDNFGFGGVNIPFHDWKISLLDALPVSRFEAMGDCSQDFSLSYKDVSLFAGHNLCSTFAPLRALLSYAFFMMTAFGIWLTFVKAINESV